MYIIYNYMQENYANKNIKIIDVGSRKGKWIGAFVRDFPNANFECFEAIPDTFAVLESRFQKYDNVNCYNYAVSNTTGNTEFYIDLQRAGWSGLKQHTNIESNYKKIDIKSTKLDDFNFNPTMIKIDTEGAELLVLEGAETTLDFTDVVYFECSEIHFSNYGYTAKDLYSLLKNKNFNIFDLRFNKLTAEEFAYVTSSDRRNEANRPRGNYIAIKNHS